MSHSQFTIFSVHDELVRYLFDSYLFNSIVSTSWLSSRGLLTSRSLELVVHCRGEHGTVMLTMRFQPSRIPDNDIIFGRDFSVLYRELYPIYGSIDGVLHDSTDDAIPVRCFDNVIPRDINSAINPSSSTVLSVTGASADMPGIRLPVDFAILHQFMQSTSGTEGYSGGFALKRHLEESILPAVNTPS
ncbi:uncharacterized protein EV420DRAFT_1714371 [Desarmillaria tabescens]|uniref:Uncharacterized protein n=1 Tax=Armillaria tabescens TaxID=1929756 RepID=A0AA39JUQ2_ARMTA|nr:uncharacterized protein EV420DRAFT_1714371 [Desarmillaria tabescens]KAK0446938.1 hypothetical protein EV420DRAFT_1714371 [Desarmillaria tabescens]